MEKLSTAEKQKRKTTFCELVEAENTGIHKYVDAIKVAPEHRKMLQAIMNEEFQHIRLLNELIKDLGEVSEMEESSQDEHHEESTGIGNESSSSDEMNKSTVVSFKRNK